MVKSSMPRKRYSRKLKVSVAKKQVKNMVETQKVKNIKKIVKSVMKKSNELKIAQQIDLANNVQVSGTGLLYDNITNFRGWCSGPSNSAGIIPSVPTGSLEGQKIGNKITPKALVLKYFLRALPTTDAGYTAGNTNPFKGVPFRVRVIVFRHRYALDDFSQTNILQNGNTASSWGSNIDNFFRPYNKDEFTIVYSKTVKMAACKHITGTTGTTITTENTPLGATSFYAGRARLPVPKVLRFNDGLDVATNQGYYLAVVLCNEDSSADSSGIFKRLELNAETSLTYYDA